MKKIILLSVIIITTNLFGQKQEQDNVTLEFEFAPLGATPLKIGGLRGRYFISDLSAFRLSLLVGGTYTPTDTETEGSPTLTDKDRTLNFSINPGYEYHFDGTDKLSPYIGGELSYSMTSTKNSDESLISLDKIRTLTTKTSNSTIGLRILAGGDYYFTDKIYLGAELGFGFTRTGREKTSYELENGYTGEVAPEDSEGNSTTLTWGPNYQATIRLGFCLK